MQFRTEIQDLNSKIDITYQSSVVFIGSCFSNNMGEKLVRLKFDTVINPFGVIYNPLSVSENINLLLEKKIISEDDIFFDNDLWASFSFHSSFSHPNKTQFLANANKQIQINSEKLKNTDVLFITWGTAWVYEVLETKKIAANCHKIPSSKFNRFLLDIDDIVKTYDMLFTRLKEINPKLQIVITVSPIRHWKDGAVGNQVSKSTLILAAKKLVSNYNYVEYFPSYEIMMDDLRDYRFYEPDMLHPNAQAIEYIWEKFGECYFPGKTLQEIKQIKAIMAAVAHKPFNPKTESHQKFIRQTLTKISELQNRINNLNFNTEIQILKSNLL